VLSNWPTLDYIKVYEQTRSFQAAILVPVDSSLVPLCCQFVLHFIPSCILLVLCFPLLRDYNYIITTTVNFL